MLKESIPAGPVLDLAAGTGILSGQLLRARRDVVAVEPLTEMLGQLRLSLPEVPAAVGTAEAIPVRDEVFAGVAVAQAFHWFDAPAALGEIARVLLVGGTLSMLFNIRDESVGWVRNLTDLIEERSGGRPYADHRERSWDSVVAESGLFDPIRAHRFDNPQPSSHAAVLDRVRSTSFVAVMDDGARRALLDDVAELLASDPDTAGRERFDYPHHTEIRCWKVRK